MSAHTVASLPTPGISPAEPAPADRGALPGGAAIDPHAVADAAASQALLRCWVREAAVAVPAAGGLLRLPLRSSGVVVEVPVLHSSPTGWHAFGAPRIAGAQPAGAATLAALLAREASARAGAAAHAASELTARVLESASHIAVHVGARAADPVDPTGELSFLAGEQALLFGHQFHPAPKSRPGVSDRELAALSPELRGHLILHWLAADPSVVSHDSALPACAPALTRRLAAGVGVPQGAVAIPAHPWQAREALSRPGLAELVERGLLRDLGPCGAPWRPTSSVRTVFQPGAPVMLKLSLGLRITNSRRENLRSELALGIYAHRLLDGLQPQLRRAHPAYRVIRDPAWIAVDSADGPEGGLETVLRESPFDGGDTAICAAGLVAERPEVGRSRLTALLSTLANRAGEPVPAVACRWLARYVDVAVAPVLWLLEEHGLGLEAHQQNAGMTLDAAGWPSGGWYRDNQGYYVSAAHAERTLALAPAGDPGARVVFPDRLVEDRVLYYLGVNHLLGMVGALGAEGVADELDLLRAVRRRLVAHRPRHGGATDRLLDDRTLPCKANLLTAADGRDELQAPVESQSVYVEVPNPLAGVMP